MVKVVPWPVKLGSDTYCQKYPFSEVCPDSKIQAIPTTEVTEPPFEPTDPDTLGWLKSDSNSVEERLLRTTGIDLSNPSTEDYGEYSDEEDYGRR